jgi:hypothetical protein
LITISPPEISGFTMKIVQAGLALFTMLIILTLSVVVLAFKMADSILSSMTMRYATVLFILAVVALIIAEIILGYSTTNS